MINDLKIKGWTKFKQENLNSEHENLVSYIKFLENKFNLQIKNTNSLIDKEIFKSTLRSLVKMSSESNYFLSQIVKQIINIDKKYEDYYVSYPYLLFHLPSDQEESGTLHTDTIKESGKSITCWSPVNDYILKYSPLTIIEKTNNIFDLYFLKILRRLLSDNQIYNFYYKKFKKITDLKPEIFESFLWDADTVHIGNLNSGDKPHYALTCKISEKPHLTEPSIKVKDYISNKKDFKNINKIEYEDLFNEINKINIKIKNFYKNYNFDNDSEVFIKILSDTKKEIKNRDLIHCIAFAYSLIGFKQKDRKLSLLQYFTSVFFLPKYLSSFYNVIMISNEVKNFSYLEFLKSIPNFDEIFQKMFKKKYKKYLV